VVESIPFSVLVLLAIAAWWGIWVYIRFASGMLPLSRMVFIGTLGTLVIVLVAMRWRRVHPPEVPAPIPVEVAVFQAAESGQRDAMDARYALRLLIEVAAPELATDPENTPTPDIHYDRSGSLSDSAFARAHRRRAAWLIRGELRNSAGEKGILLHLIVTRLDAEGGPIHSDRIAATGVNGAAAGVNAVRDVLQIIGRKSTCDVCLEPYTPDALRTSAEATRITNPAKRERFLIHSMPRDESLQPYYWMKLAILRLGLGNTDGAYEAATRALTSATRLAPAWSVLAKVESRRGQRKEAERLWRRALAEDPRSVDALLGMAALRQVDKGGGASRESFLERAVRMRPGNVSARLAYADWLEQTALQPEEALKTLREGFEYTGDNRLLQRESAALIRMNQWNRAESLLERVVRADSMDANAWYNMGLALRNLQQLSAAEGALQRSVRLGGPADAHFVLGLVYEAKGDTVLALEEYRLRWVLRDPTTDDRTANAARARLHLLSK